MRPRSCVTTSWRSPDSAEDSDLERDEDLMGVVRHGVQQYEDHMASLSPEKARLHAEAQELADRDEESVPPDFA